MNRTVTIAIAGKGGVGKTTTAGLLIRYLKEKGLTPVLAVDADANSNLHEVLGLAQPAPLSEAREEMKTAAPTGSMTKNTYIDMKVNQALAEENGFDLLAMGRPEGPGCYCAANHLLSASLEKLLDNYSFMVVDNEAGMEHLSRLVTKRIDHLLVVSDPSRRSLETALRIRDLAKSLPMTIGRTGLVVNRAPEGRLFPGAVEMLRQAGLELLGVLPGDDRLAELDAAGKPTSTELPDDSPVVRAAFEVFDKLELKKI